MRAGRVVPYEQITADFGATDDEAWHGGAAFVMFELPVAAPHPDPNPPIAFDEPYGVLDLHPSKGSDILSLIYRNITVLVPLSRMRCSMW
jgi:hypothetical protein